MNIRNPKYTSQGAIDCEYEHPVYGWIPFTASQFDSEPLGRDIYAIAVLSEVAPADPETQLIQQEVTAATQKRLDDFARTRNYDGILSACTYATSSVPKFAAEGQYAVDARDNTWATLYAFMDDVQAGTQPMPSGYADVEPLLPSLNWP